MWHGTVRQVRKHSHAKRKSHVIVMSAGPLQSAIAASRPSKGSPLIETMVISQGLGPPSTTMSGCGNQGKPRASRCYCTPGAGRAHGSHGICQHQHQRLHLAVGVFAGRRRLNWTEKASLETVSPLAATIGQLLVDELTIRPCRLRQRLTPEKRL